LCQFCPLLPLFYRRENSDGNRDRKQEDGNRRMVEDANTQGHATILGGV